MNSYRQSLYTSMVRIGANVVMLGAVFLAMHQAFRWPGWPSEAVFCLFFFGITVPVWTGAIFLNKYIRRRWPAAQQSLVRLPGLGEQLVTWQVSHRLPAPRMRTAPGS